MTVSKKESQIGLHAMKKIEIIVSGEYEAMIADLMQDSNVTGFTLIRNVSGLGHNGFHEGKLLFNDASGLIMFIAVAPEEVISDISVGMRNLFEKNSGVMFVSDVGVVRLNYFAKDSSKK